MSTRSAGSTYSPYNTFQGFPNQPTMYSQYPYPQPPPFAHSILSNDTFAAHANHDAQPAISQTNKYPYPPPEDSRNFFNQFLASKTEEIARIKAQQAQKQPAAPRSQTQSQHSSPSADFKTPAPGSYGTPTATNISPQKRKAEEDHFNAPAVKRLHPVDQMNWSPHPQSTAQDMKMPIDPMTPMKFTNLPTVSPNRRPYVSVPIPPGWKTPNIDMKMFTPDKRYRDFSATSTPTLTPSPRKAGDGHWNQEDSDRDDRSSAPVPPSTVRSKASNDERSKIPNLLYLILFLILWKGTTDRFTSFIDDVFEAEDSVPAEPPDNIEESELQGYFSKLTDDWSQPILNTRIVIRLTKIIDAIAKPTKRARREALMHSPGQGQHEGLAGVELHQLSRILKILERAVARGEDVDPFSGPVTRLKSTTSGTTTGGDAGKSPAKGKKGRKGKSPEGRRSKSQTPVEGDNENEMDEGTEEVNWDRVERALGIAREAILSTDACVALLSADRLPKQVCPSQSMDSLAYFW